ncbi:hypothetical protein GCM10007421_33470 [Halopseudomonas oceani]|nr:hypothetical protein GCM10007421_33470 [Halopseudomonas oceani]
MRYGSIPRQGLIGEAKHASCGGIVPADVQLAVQYEEPVRRYLEQCLEGGCLSPAMPHGDASKQ